MQSPAHPARTARGFSLLEVMVAIGILGLAVTLILSAQGGLAATNKRAANMGIAISLGRCRMTELEEKLLKLGYSEVDEIDSSRNCCNDNETPGFTCEWRIEKILLPPPPDSTTGDGGLSFVNGTDGGFGGGLGGMALGLDGGFPSLDLDAGLAMMGQTLQGQFGSNTGGALGLLSMVFTIIYPSLKPVLEASIRRITLTVKWHEGLASREFALVQYVTNPMRAGFMSGANIDGGVPTGAGTTAPGPTGLGGLGAPGGASPFGGSPMGGSPMSPGGMH